MLQLLVEAHDPDLESLLKWLETKGNLSLEERMELLDRAKEWLSRTSPFSYALAAKCNRPVVELLMDNEEGIMEFCEQHCARVRTELRSQG